MFDVKKFMRPQSYVVVEAVDEEEMDRWPAGDLEAYANEADQSLLNRLKRSTDLHSIEYISLRGDRLALTVGDGSTAARSINGNKSPSWTYIESE
ncbi:hypothetical protein GE107_16280 [Cohnella sp. CFH 77786]|uniref:hypothetical protein n=1 Tax=Cohnella sp. CFH 77786 TaxID=2662265 RepID=UPI001C60DE80|nr:hypothetical protein [Cohnella sp. CFH 77786]MBW5447616.1 hypothetical protein [Cohnella sp. CFH 77786]